MAKIKIPSKAIDPVLTEPRNLIIYAPPKLGKTVICTQIPNSLIIEHDPDGMKAHRGRYVEISHPDDLMPLLEQLKTHEDKSNPINTIIIDTITRWDEWSELVGTYNFMKKPQGKKWNLIGNEKINHADDRFQTVHEIGDGYGYRYSREVVLNWYKAAIATGKTVIFLAHVKDKFIESGSGASMGIVETKEINLTGKLRTILPSKAQAIASFKRVGRKGYLVFETGGEAVAGSWFSYLKGNILISESDENDKVTTYWDKIFPSMFKK